MIRRIYRWRPTRRWILRAGGVAALAFLIVVICGYLFEWKWTGLVTDANYAKRTLWDWLELLIVPAVLAIGGYLFTRSENRAAQAATDRRAQDEALQAYLDGMSQLLIDENRPLHEAQPDDSLSTVARARTLTVLTRLHGARQGNVVQFLYESGLITKEHTVLSLRGADLIGAYLPLGSNLREANLSDTRLLEAHLHGADLREANLSGTDLRFADLRSADLRKADRREAQLYFADLSFANLSRADLSGAAPGHAALSQAQLNGANLSDAFLSKADLRGAYLWRSNLSDADLSEANLTKAMVRLEQLGQAVSLEGATMPNGQKYEDWLKSKGSGEDGENSGPS